MRYDSIEDAMSMIERLYHKCGSPLKKDKETLITVKTRKFRGHIRRNRSRYHLLWSFLQRKIPAKNGVGRV